MKENDIILGSFAVETIENLTESELDSFEALLRENDNDIYNWVTEREALPAHLNNIFMSSLIAFNKVK